jgi:hypothetical protein
MMDLSRRREATGEPMPGFGPFCWSDAQSADEAVWLDPAERPRYGYAKAFTDPPHSLWHRRRASFEPHIRLTGPETLELFVAIDTIVLGEPIGDIDIVRWEGGVWAPYFDEGLEWWGAQAWTLRIAQDRIIAIGASATD